MTKQYEIIEMNAALAKRDYPTILMWNRLEGRPRADNFDRALKAEVRDPLWMLTKQWQMGEFMGDDAGSPVFAKIHLTTTRLNKYRAKDQAVQEFENEVPLETKVEQREIPFKVGEQKISLDIRLLMGSQWLKLVSKVGNFNQDYINKYPIEAPAATLEEKDAPVRAHPEVWQKFSAAAGRAMDGAALYFYLMESAAHHAYDDIGVPPAQEAEIDRLAEKFVRWFQRLFYQPHDPDNNAWQPSALEYRFDCSAPGEQDEKVLNAEEYYSGHLDWYNMDVDKTSPGLGNPPGDPVPENRQSDTQSFIPVPIQFDGMPNTRWWAFENSKTSFGDIKPDTKDIAKLLLMEFGLLYANDWFMVPYTVPAGTVIDIKGLAVTNVFGERTWIEAAGRGKEHHWHRWNMFTLNYKEGEAQQSDMSLLVLPTVPKIQEGTPFEEVVLIRDETANMVWGIETVVPLADGSSKPGNEVAAETRDFYQKLLDKKIADEEITITPVDYKAAIRYQVMSSVPENWIPFIPVHEPGDFREIRLQRAAMPRVLEGGPKEVVKVQPRTPLLREGLDREPREPYFVNEEEVPRAGIRVSRSFQRTRWYNGRVFLWFGARKKTGKGEGSSGLAFDRIMESENKSKSVNQ